MELFFDKNLGVQYRSPSQKARVMTEAWVGKTIFCPNCGQYKIDKFENGKPVADFYCQNCKEEYELKSKNGSIGTKIVDGAYNTMISRLKSNNNPNFFFLNYNAVQLVVNDFIVIPKHFFIPEIIEKRKPLVLTAQRAGWVGCNILLSSIPQSGRIYFVRDGKSEPKDVVIRNWQKTLFLRDEKQVKVKGWLLDIMNCIEGVGKKTFTLADIYKLAHFLSVKHPGNKHIKDKIRQQLQILRDKKYLEFTDRGVYQLI